MLHDVTGGLATQSHARFTRFRAQFGEPPSSSEKDCFSFAPELKEVSNNSDDGSLDWCFLLLKVQL